MGITIGARAMRVDLIQKEAVVTLLITSGYQCFSEVTAEDLVRLAGWLQAEAHRLRRVDPYHTLEVSRTATADEIQSAYRILAKQYHPDRAGDLAAMQELNAAYDMLNDPEKRRQYDATSI